MMQIYEMKKGDRLPESIADRTQLDDPEVQETVRGILKDVRARGDEALLEYTEKFDKVRLEPELLRVTGDEVNDAYQKIDDTIAATIRLAVANIRAFHEKQCQKTWLDITARTVFGQMVIPIAKVGLYVPGGTAPLLSSVMMNAIPAKVAGCERIVMVTPPRPDGSIAPEILVAAYESGVMEIYKVGGAQAIAALAYGTQSIEAVDKIVGPGNIYVANAKREVFGAVGVDMIAGPSEILIIADADANARWVAADLIAQAEHDALSASYLITDSKTLCQDVLKEIEKQLADLPRADIARKALEGQGAMMLVPDMLTAIHFSNLIAPEHLEICCADPMGLLGWVKNAGACFLGPYSPEPMGDYFAGPNHVLPTSGTARFSSALSVDDFIKKTSVIRYSSSVMKADAREVSRLARAEQLEGHARAVEMRLEDDAT